MNETGLLIGAKIRHFRQRNGNRSQSVIAGLCSITERYLQQIEAGEKVPSVPLLGRIADALGVPIAALLSEEFVDESVAPLTAAPAVTRALISQWPKAPGTNPESSGPLRARVDLAWESWQTSRDRFTEAAEILPTLIGDVEYAVSEHRLGRYPDNGREVLRAAADLYGLLRSYCRRAGRLDLALLVADRAIRAAEEAADPVRMAAARWNLGHAFLSHSDPSTVEEAGEIALLAIEQLRRTHATKESKSVEGALELVAAVSDAKRRRWWQARERLEQRAAPLARLVGEGNVQWTVFGPVNVEMHAMSIEMLAGQSAEGLRIADGIDASQLPSRERRFTYGLELARCHDLRREDAAVFLQLRALEEMAPQDLIRSPLARLMIFHLERRARPVLRREVSAFVERLQLV